MPRPCRAPTMQLWKGLLNAKAGERRGHSSRVWIDIDRLSTAFGRPAQVRLFPVTTRTFSRVFQNAATFGMCLIVLITMETADCTEYERTLKIKLIFLLLLYYGSTVYSFHCMWATTLHSFSYFETPILKYWKMFCLLSLRRPNRVCNSPSSSYAQNTVWIQYFRFTNFPSPERRQSPHAINHVLLTTVHADDSQEWYQQKSKENPLNCWTSSSDFSGYHAEFYEGHGTIESWQGHSTSRMN